MVVADPKQEVREAQFTFDVSDATEIEIDSKNTRVEIESWDQSKVEVYALLEFKGRMNGSAQEFLDEFQSIVKNNIRATSNSISIDTDLNEPNKVQIGSKHVGFIIGYSDDDLKITYRIKVPESNDMEIDNSYEELRLDGRYSGEVTIDHYSGELIGGDFASLELELKYGKASLGNVLNGEFSLYEQDIEIESFGKGMIECKYSKISIDEIDELELDSYESKLRIDLGNKLEGELKYGKIEIDEKMEEVLFSEIYELEIEAKSIGTMRLPNSKYSDIEISNIKTLQQIESYEDNVRIGSISRLESQSKYAEYDIDQLEGSIELDGYESDVEIESTSESVDLISMSGKYCTLDLRIGNKPFHLDVNTQYGKIDYPDSNIDRKIFIKEGSKREIEVSSKDAKDGDMRILIKGYEMDASIY